MPEILQGLSEANIEQTINMYSKFNPFCSYFVVCSFRNVTNIINETITSRAILSTKNVSRITEQL